MGHSRMELIHGFIALGFHFPVLDSIFFIERGHRKAQEWELLKWPSLV